MDPFTAQKYRNGFQESLQINLQSGIIPTSCRLSRTCLFWAHLFSGSVSN